MKIFDAYIINLDSRKDRLDGFFKNHEEKGWGQVEFNRISAILDKDFGGLGCAKSHLLALSSFIAESKADYCLIVEDDFRFRNSFSDFLIDLKNLVVYDPMFNVFLLAGTRLISTENIGDRLMRIFESQSTSGYLISRQYIPKLIDNILRSILLMERFRNSTSRELIYDRFSIDQTWKKLQHEGAWYASHPMLGFQVESYSDIEDKVVNYDHISA